MRNCSRLREAGAVLRRKHSASAGGEQKMKHKDSAAKMAAFPVNTAAKMAAFPVSRGSYQQPSATRQKKGEAKKRKSPCTPFREKAKGKESDRRVLSRNRLSRADARATARSVIAPYHANR